MCSCHLPSPSPVEQTLLRRAEAGVLPAPVATGSRAGAVLCGVSAEARLQFPPLTGVRLGL